jgi:hypothetical protein
MKGLWKAETWREHLTTHQDSGVALFSDAYLQRWGDETWAPNDQDRKAAGALHTQIASRIATQRLKYREGVEITALNSIYGLFDQTRRITDEHAGCRHFDTLAWEVLNTHVRPFTAKWHRRSEEGALSALDATDGQNSRTFSQN